MTKKEFFLKTIISMCGNPQNIEIGYDTNSKRYYDFKADKIIKSANLMLEKTVQEWPDVFDEPTK